MAINWQKLAVVVMVFIAITFILLYAFPLTIKTNEYDFTTHSYKTETNYTAIIGIILTFIILALFLMKQEITEGTIVKTPQEILTEKNNKIQQQLASFGLAHPLNYKHINFVGKFTEIGYLYLIEVLDQLNESVFITLIGEDNYSTTTVRQRFTSPIISISREFYDLRGITRYMLPKEKRELTSTLKSIYKELKEEDKEYARMLLEKATEEEEEV